MLFDQYDQWIDNSVVDDDAIVFHVVVVFSYSARYCSAIRLVACHQYVLFHVEADYDFLYSWSDNRSTISFYWRADDGNDFGDGAGGGDYDVDCGAYNVYDYQCLYWNILWSSIVLLHQNLHHHYHDHPHYQRLFLANHW